MSSLEQFLRLLTADWVPGLRDRVRGLPRDLTIPPSQNDETRPLMAQYQGEEFRIKFEDLHVHLPGGDPPEFFRDQHLYSYLIYWAVSEPADAQEQHRLARLAAELAFLLNQKLSNTQDVVWFGEDESATPLDQVAFRNFEDGAIPCKHRDQPHFPGHTPHPFECLADSPEFNRVAWVRTPKAIMVKRLWYVLLMSRTVEMEKERNADGSRNFAKKAQSRRWLFEHAIKNDRFAPAFIWGLLWSRELRTSQTELPASPRDNGERINLSEVSSYGDYLKFRADGGSHSPTNSMRYHLYRQMERPKQPYIYVDSWNELIGGVSSILGILLITGTLLTEAVPMVTGALRTIPACSLIREYPYLSNPSVQDSAATVLVWVATLAVSWFCVLRPYASKMIQSYPDLHVAYLMDLAVRSLEIEGQLPESYRGWLGKAK
jgi:hypothetical protein